MTGQFVGTTNWPVSLSITRVIEIDGAFYLLSIYSSQRASGGLVFCRSYLRELEVHRHQLEMSEDPSSSRCFDSGCFCPHEEEATLRPFNSAACRASQAAQITSNVSLVLNMVTESTKPRWTPWLLTVQRHCHQASMQQYTFISQYIYLRMLILVAAAKLPWFQGRLRSILPLGGNKHEVVETHKEQNFEITGLIP